MPQQFSDNNTDKVFREKLSGIRVEPRSRVWYRVSAGLDRNASLNAHKKRKVFGLLIGIILITGITLTAVLDPTATRKIVSNFDGQILTPDVSEHKNQNLISKAHLSSKQDVSIHFFTGRKNIQNNIETTIGASTIATATTEILINNINYFNPRTILFTNEYQNSQAVDLDKQITIQLLKNKKFSLRNLFYTNNCNNNLYIGGYFNINNSTFKDQELKQNTNYESKPKYGNAITVFAGYRFLKHLSAEMGYTVFSDKGVNYSNVTMSREKNSKPVNNDYEISLRYQQFPLKLRYEVEIWSGILNKKVSYSLAIGANYGKLKEVKYSNSDYIIDSKFKQTELSAEANIEVSVKLNSHLSVFTGASASYGNRIFLEAQRVSPFNYPHNFLVGLQAGMKYNFCSN